MESQKTRVESLGGARLPADLGLSSLGLIMQLVGSLSMAFMAYVAIIPVFGRVGGDTFLIFFVGVTGVIRGAFHRAAGTSILYEGLGRPKQAVRRYIGVAILETVLWGFFLIKVGAPTLLTVTVSVALITWPATLAFMLSRPRYVALLEREEVPQSEDLGFEGSGILMLVLGVIGTVIGAMVLFTLVKLPGSALSSPAGLLFIGVFMMLLARSAIHAYAGYKATLGVDTDSAGEAAARYYSFGVVSSVITGGALLVLLMMTSLHPVGLLMVGIVLWLLLLWPLLLRRFYTEKNFSVLLAGSEGPVRRRSPDAGMTALGWVLLGLGVVGVAFALPQFAVDGSNPLATMLGGRAFASEAAASSPWWSLGIAGVQLWAGYELTQMSDRYRLAANIYGAVATLVTIYLVWPTISNMELSGLGPMQWIGSLMSYCGVALALVVPVTTVLLVNRKITPTATARITGAL